MLKIFIYSNPIFNIGQTPIPDHSGEKKQEYI